VAWEVRENFTRSPLRTAWLAGLSAQTIGQAVEVADRRILGGIQVEAALGFHFTRRYSRASGLSPGGKSARASITRGATSARPLGS
jgi:hypothetical protein